MAEKVEIIVNAKDNASGVLKGISGAMGGINDAAKTVAKVGFAVMGAAALGAAAIIKDSIGLASDLGETQNKMATIFGDAAGLITEGTDAWGTSMGQTRQQMLDAASTFGIFGKAAGLTGGDLADFSLDMVGLSSDLASFHNTSPEDAALALGAALRGEMEPIRRYGVLLDDASLRQKALEMGLVKTTKDALTPQNKALAAQALIMEQTKDAQGDFVKTSDGLANSQRIIAAQFEEAKTTLGEGFLPIVEEAAAFIKNNIMPVFTDFAQKVSDVAAAFAADGLQGALVEMFGLEVAVKIWNIVDAMRTFVDDTLLPFINEHAETLKGALMGVAIAFGALMIIGTVAGLVAMLANPITLIIAVAALLGAAWAGNWGGIQEKTAAVWAILQPIFEQVKTWLGENIPIAIQTLTDFWNNTLYPALEAIWKFLSVDMIPIWDALGELLSVTVTKAVEVLTAIWNEVLLPAMKDLWAFIQGNLIPKVDDMVSAFGPAETVIANVAGFIRDVSDAIASLNIGKLLQLLGLGGGGSGGVEGRYTGGPVSGGNPYMVGEQGPELFVPNRGGQVINAQQTSELLSMLKQGAGGQGNGGTINFYISNPDPRAVADEVGRLLAGSYNTGGAYMG